ncbi:radical SAM/SPASM protein FxsBH, inactivated beta-hydroxylase extension form [Streptomyces caniscabiei]|uniref:Radical SAM/SPASM protein FxsB, inactivated metallohydrolase extension form n=1 Tax=Streptomyces caniscabiei TaxID=2746961 RepID=A0ABU4MNT1_9ACTN|nr:radical SAM/SPASM protein FxsB, inactivated metallohydrolase extension form [Streptomyces caniscabiei]MBE4737841.1 FxsB family radical SAM/SPASM domain protein [Streptomyces caniscabiei]MBE4757360.1 FxsB family radical SAM/SPASM domain protein [Streptomyces caniscabiei]MBE4769359.1 FxsB family radical SAM/SPASM domain protein [Streptomyces caniscabiei]MBE4784920.1 FxsB family radical SAM/SPASM domain protein [Streptomyces caniscabiei]MBE4795704.1 FxsB family radical SAM/SPASM domain protein
MTDFRGQRSIQQLVLKVHSRCDLACDHCYVYEHADQSWRGRPVVIAEETLGQVARRLAEYAADSELESVAVILHGGEPLLAGPARLRHMCEELTRVLSPVTTLDLRIHTNGVQLNKRHLEVFREFGVKIGISLDGDRVANDRHRLDRRGRSSYDRVLRAIGLLCLPEYRDLFQGLLCTVDVANDPVAVHDALTALEPPRVDYLLPHSTWDSPPPGHGGGTPYADWLLKIFDRWVEQGRPMPVRTFDSVLSTLRGGPSLTEALGLAPSDLAVIETDGTFEQADSLKTAYEGAPATGYDVFRHGFAEFAEHPGVRARQLGIAGVSETCRRCPVVESCGGGLYAHRYSAEKGFDNPSVFCSDLRGLVEGIAERITERALHPAVADTEDLRLAQLELNRTLLARVNSELSGHPDWDATWGLLVALDSDAAAAAHLDTVLAHPYLRPVLLRALEGHTDLPRLAATAVAASVLAETEAALTWWQPDRDLHLPTLGTLRLSAPGRVECVVTADGLQVTGTDQDGRELHVEWRPLRSTDLTDGPLLLIDDADPYRDCYPVPVATPLSPSDLALFGKRLRAAYDAPETDAPSRPPGPDASLCTTITPLAAGAGLLLPGTDTPGALGVAVDFEPEELARELPRLLRRSRLAALRQIADLNVPGTGAGRLLDEASEAIGRATAATDPAARTEELRRARDTIDRLTDLQDAQLTESGVHLAEELRREWVTLHG